MKEDLPEAETKVKLATCQICQGIIACAISHHMTTKDKNQFAKDAMRRNLSITEIPLLDYRANVPEWCFCKNNSDEKNR